MRKQYRTRTWEPLPSIEAIFCEGQGDTEDVLGDGDAPSPLPAAPAAPSAPASDTATDAVVYFVQAEGNGLVKIGTTRKLQQRLDAMRTGSPVELWVLGTLPGSHQREREIHAQFASARRGGEWFLPTTELMEFVAAHTSAPTYGARPESLLSRLWYYEYHREVIAHARCNERLNELGAQGWALNRIDKNEGRGDPNDWDCIFWRVQIDRAGLRMLLEREPEPVERTVLERWRAWHEQRGAHEA